MRKLVVWIILFSFGNASPLYYVPKLQEHPIVFVAIIGLAVLVMLLLFFFLEHQKKLGKHEEVVMDMPLQKNLRSDKPFRRSYEVYVPEKEKNSEKPNIETKSTDNNKPKVAKQQIKPEQKIKDVSAKLSKYVGDKSVLDIQKGIARSHTAIFYKEQLREVLELLKDSENFVEKTITQRDDKSLEAFIVKAMRYSEEIAAHKFLKLLKEIHQLFIYKEHYRLSEYISLYNKTCHELKKEIESYLKSSAL